MAGPSILFEVLKNILQLKSEKLYHEHVSNELLWKTYTSFMTLRYLSMHRSEEVRSKVIGSYATLERMPAKAQYLWLLRNIPQQSNSYIQYIK